MSRDRFVHYLTGNHDIDSEHWDLLSMMALIIDDLRAKDFLLAFPKIKELLDIFENHLIHEDRIMELAKYPFKQPHNADHTTMLSIIHQFESMINQNEKINDHHINKLSEMFLIHIDHYDMQMVDYINTHS